ncbi:hypothetical protein CBL_06390 [Carabus blaptoides fortunei]
MGNLSSKQENKQGEETENASVPSTPISTPKTRVIEDDPRSPSTNIVRTPIQIGPNISKLNTPIIGVINTLAGESDDFSKDNLVMNVDPRSPSVEFTRTPIVAGNVPGKFRNKNLDHVKKQLTEFSPLKKVEKSENQSVEQVTPVKTVQGPILLEVTPITKKLEQAQKRKSYVGLLETNLDYVETNLDTVANKLNSLGASNDENIAEVDITEEEENIEICEVIEKENKISSEMENESDYDEMKEQQIQETVDNKTDEEIIETVVEESTESTDIQVKNEEECVNNISVEEPSTPDTTQESNISQTYVHKLEIISPIKETLEKISQIDQEIKDVIAHNPVVNFDESNPSRDFSQKVSNLIYEDQQNYERVAKVTRTKDDNRAPLSERSVNQHGRQKSINKLKVSDKPLMNKLDYSVSKIPVFKDKKSKSKVLKQCENTPPRQKHTTDVKVKKTQWDADNTLII